jgi:copper chaperone
MKISIDGMHCDACVRRVRMALQKVEGIQVRDVAIGSAEVDEAHQAAAMQAIEKAGYQPHIPA